MLAVGKSRKHHPLLLLHNQVWKTPSLPVQNLREDVLLEHWYLLSLQHRRAIFDEVAPLSVEGMSKSAIARVKRIAWNTVHRWLEKAAVWWRRFGHRKLKGLSFPELQADEIRT